MTATIRPASTANNDQSRRGSAKGPRRLLQAEDLRVSTDTSANGDDVPVLELKGLCKSFGGLQAVRDVTLRDHAGRPQGHHRPERRRQDHAVQSHHRHLPGDVRPGAAVRPGRHRLAEPPPHRARHGAHVPGHQPVPEIDRARQRAAGDQGPAAVEIRDVALPVVVQGRLRQGLSICSNRPASSTARTPRFAICRTANSASSRSCSGSPAIRRSCCSTSRPPACRRANPPRWPSS